eukprot:4752741-Ditylum_brightwellii.AAC.1
MLAKNLSVLFIRDRFATIRLPHANCAGLGVVVSKALLKGPHCLAGFDGISLMLHAVISKLACPIGFGGADCCSEV